MNVTSDEYITDMNSGVFRNLKRQYHEGTFQVYIVKIVQMLAYFFTLKISTKNFHLQGGWGVHVQRPPKYAPKYDNDNQSISRKFVA